MRDPGEDGAGFAEGLQRDRAVELKLECDITNSGAQSCCEMETKRLWSSQNS